MNNPDRRYIWIQLPDESIVLDVPFVAPMRRYPQIDAANTTCNMTYATGEDMKNFKAYPSPDDVEGY